MSVFKYITPFLWTFPVCIVLAVKTWLGHFSEINLTPNRSMLFIAMGFTMLIIDLFLKYLLSKDKLHYVWIMELVIIIILCVMIIPRVYALRNV